MTDAPGQAKADFASIIRADLEADYNAQMDRAVGEMLGDLSNWKPEGLSGFLDAITRPAPGYEEIASEGGIRWHRRIDPDAEDPAT